MKSIKEKAREKNPYRGEDSFDEYTSGLCIGWDNGYIQGATDQKVIDKELIEMLINELLTSRAYHLGITGLDSDVEIKRKTIEGDCALIRGIDRTIKYVREVMED